MLSEPESYPDHQTVSDDLSIVLQEPLQSPSLSLPPSPLPLPQVCRLASVMPLPPEAIYSSSQELYSAIQAHAKQYNYTFVQANSKLVNQHGRQKILYYCDYYKQPPAKLQSKATSQAQKQKTTTRKTGYKFSVNAVQIDNTY